MAITIDEIRIADPQEAWTEAGFQVDPDGVCRVGNVRLRLMDDDACTGVMGWSLRDAPSWIEDVDGVPTVLSTAPPAEPAEHSNGVVSIDHVVLVSPNIARTVDLLSGIGLEARRERDGKLGGMPVRQVFYRLGDVILELVGPPKATGHGQSSLWGITYTVADIDATAKQLGNRTSAIKDAVQPGRRITTVRNRDYGISLRTAMISPPV